MYRTNQVTGYLHAEAFAEFEKKRKRLDLSKNQMVKLCILQALGLIRFDVPEDQIKTFLRGK